MQVFLSAQAPSLLPSLLRLVRRFRLHLSPVRSGRHCTDPRRGDRFHRGIGLRDSVGTVFSTIGLVLGSIFAFFLARTFGVGVVRKVVRREFMERFDRFSSSPRGFTTFFMFFLIPGVPKDSVCYLLGLSSMTLADFMLINVFARLPGTVILSLQGNAVSRGHYGLFLAIFLASTALLAALYPLRRFFFKSYPAA